MCANKFLVGTNKQKKNISLQRKIYLRTIRIEKEEIAKKKAYRLNLSKFLTTKENVEVTTITIKKIHEKARLRQKQKLKIR